MTVLAVAAVPAVPPPADASDPQVDLQREARAVFAASAGLTARVLLASGPSSVIHDRAVVAGGAGGADLAGGADRAGAGLEVPVDRDLLAALAARTGFPRGRTDLLEGPLAELVRWSVHVEPLLPVLPVEIPAKASGDTLEAVATGLRGAAEATDRAVSVVAVGDLAARGAGDRHAADDFDALVVGALRRGDLDALSALGPDRAAELDACGWAPLMVAALVADLVDLTPREVHYLAGRDAGHVVLCP